MHWLPQCQWRHPGPWFNIKMSSYQYRKSHCGDKTVVRSSYLHNGISYADIMSSLYWIRAQKNFGKITAWLELTNWTQQSTDDGHNSCGITETKSRHIDNLFVTGWASSIWWPFGFSVLYWTVYRESGTFILCRMVTRDADWAGKTRDVSRVSCHAQSASRVTVRHRMNVLDSISYIPIDWQHFKHVREPWSRPTLM